MSSKYTIKINVLKSVIDYYKWSTLNKIIILTEYSTKPINNPKLNKANQFYCRQGHKRDDFIKHYNQAKSSTPKNDENDQFTRSGKRDLRVKSGG